MIGVLAVDLFLERIQMFLSTLKMSATSEAFILNDDGLVLAAYTPACTGDLPSHNLLVKESPFKYMPSAVNLMEILTTVNDNNIEKHSFTRGRSHATTVNLLEEEGYLYSTAIGEEHGANRTLGVYIPKSDFLQSSNKHIVSLVPLAVIRLLLINTALRMFLSVVIRPLEKLRENALKITSGNFSTNVDTSMTNEVGELAKSINSMQQSLQSSFTEIESSYEELSKEKCRIETTLRSIADGVISIDRNNNILYMNPTTESLVGWKFTQALH